MFGKKLIKLKCKKNSFEQNLYFPILNTEHRDIVSVFLYVEKR